MIQTQIKGESKLIAGHVLDVSKNALLGTLRRYDPQLYLKWNPKKTKGRGVWELRRKPEFKSIREGRYLEVPNKGKVFFPGDIFEFDNCTITVPKYHETREDCIKDFEYLGYHIVTWVAEQDLWQYGFKGKDFATESDYKASKFEEKIDEDSYNEKQYMLKDMRTQIQDFREYVLSGGNPYRLIDYWGK